MEDKGKQVHCDSSGFDNKSLRLSYITIQDDLQTLKRNDI